MRPSPTSTASAALVASFSQGCLGLGDTTDRHTWTLVPGLSSVTAIASGFQQGYAIANGTLYATGWNSHGQLGLGDTISRNTWTLLSDPFGD